MLFVNPAKSTTTEKVSCTAAILCHHDTEGEVREGIWLDLGKLHSQWKAALDSGTNMAAPMSQA